ncbi:MAG: HNH endonuclease [Blastocatellia bacterium]|nr:HNH endonuclease [Blastocatellia bacterium]
MHPDSTTQISARVCQQCGKTFDCKPWLPFKNCSIACRAAAQQKPLTERFWAKVDKRGPDECWLWLDSTRYDGYGRFLMNRKIRAAHRVSYELAHGSIPEGLLVHHRCAMTSCVNPAHLELVTYSTNLRYRYALGRPSTRPTPLPPRQYVPIEKPCQFCGCFFRVGPFAAKSRKYCSPSCSIANRFGSSPEDRFWRKVDKSGECWLWTAALHEFGYGMTAWNGKQTTAHRVAWELAHGPIPAGMLVCHNCPGGDNPRCCRPDHMFLGTQTDNMRDCSQKNRCQKGDMHHMRRFGQPACGEKAPHSKLTDAIVIAIRTRIAAGELQRILAAEYGIDQGHVSQIVRRRIWKHLP